MTPHEVILYINIVVAIFAGIFRSGLNINGTGWLERIYAKAPIRTVLLFCFTFFCAFLPLMYKLHQHCQFLIECSKISQ